MSTIAYQPSFYNVAPRCGGLTLAIPYSAGSGSVVLASLAGLPAPPFRLWVVTAASRGTGLNEILTCYGVSSVNSSTNVLTIAAVLEGTADRNYSIGDIAEIRDSSGAIADLNDSAIASVPSVVLGVVAAGSSQSTATPLVGNNSIQEVTDGAGGVSLPAPTLPASVVVINADPVNTLDVYPPAGGTIFNSSLPVMLPPGTARRWVASTTTNYYTVS